MIVKTVPTDLHKSYPSSFEVSHECYLGTSLVLLIKFIYSLKTTFDTWEQWIFFRDKCNWSKVQENKRNPYAFTGQQCVLAGMCLSLDVLSIVIV